ncbi:MAG: hypothetical protein AABY22_15700 [Nanoarchaeota archaeon]
MNKQQQITDILLKYLLPDALKPEYDGMTAYELAGIILKKTDTADLERRKKCFASGCQEDGLEEYTDEDKNVYCFNHYFSLIF